MDIVAIVRRDTTAAAGVAAQEKFETRRALWRRERRNAMLLTLVALTLPVLAVAILTHGAWRWSAIFVLGANVGMGLWVWDSPPEHIERWRRGADGEKSTAKQLAKLPDDWIVEHDIDSGRGNWDHVVVGPSGAFLIDSKNLMGRATVEDGVLVLRRREDPDEVTRFENLPVRVRGMAWAVRDRLVDPGGRLWVSGVVAVWPELEGGVAQGDRIVYVSGPRLTEWLREQPERQNAERLTSQSKRITDRLRRTS